MCAEFVLRPAAAAPPVPRHTGGSASAAVLAGNVFWFIRLRWMVTGTFVATAVIGWLGEAALAARGVEIPETDFLLLAAVLAVANTFFIWHARRAVARESATTRPAGASLACQVGLDLVVLGATVHLLGSVETLACVVYLFHIALACIFFGHWMSLAVAIAASLSYVAVVLLESIGILRGSGILVGLKFREALFYDPLILGAWLASFVAISLTMWYLVSTLAQRVRERDAELEHANRACMRMTQEQEQHMLHVTHELKAPFAAIQANTQLLLKGYCGELPAQARSIVEKIDVRSQKLTGQIKEMLQLSNLRTAPSRRARHVSVDLARLCRNVLDSLQAEAERRSVHVNVSLQAASTRGVPDHLHMMISNVVANAIAYSHEGGTVDFSCSTEKDACACVTISDHGIGIPEKNMARIFAEYFRCNVAAQHNPLSTGIGLAIVKHVAQTHAAAIRVSSRVGEGTTFELRFPAHA